MRLLTVDAEQPSGELRQKAENLLQLLEFEAGTQDLENRLALLRFAARIDGVFRLRSRHAPGLSFFGGTFRTGSVTSGPTAIPAASFTGAGETARAAFEACIGEGIEYLSQFGLPEGDRRVAEPTPEDFGGDHPLRGSVGARLARDGLSGSKIDWIPALRLADRDRTWLPAFLVLRGSLGGASTWTAEVGFGCAAASDWKSAVWAAFLEAVERDAVALWWRGGRTGHPIAIEDLTNMGAWEFLSRIRASCRTRLTTLLDITPEFGIPCVAAISLNPDGTGFAAGFACRFNAALAVRAALIEMCQMELGHDVVAYKRARSATIGEADQRQELRGTRIGAHQRGLLDGLAGPISLQDPGLDGAQRAIADAARELRSRGFESYVVDLTRAEFGVPVACVVIPGLQPYPSPTITPRLAKLMAERPPYCADAQGIELF